LQQGEHFVRNRLPVFLAVGLVVASLNGAYGQEALDDRAVAGIGGLPGERWVAEDRYDEFAVVVAENAPAETQEAARTFKRLWERATGEEIELRNDIGDGVNVMVGAETIPLPILQELGLIRLPISPDMGVDLQRQLAHSGLARDGFMIKTLGDTLVIVGATPAGAQHGVEWFFENVMGYDAAEGVFTAPPQSIPRIDATVNRPHTAWAYVAYITLGLLALFLIHWMVNRIYDEEVPLGLSIPLCIAAIASCVVFFVWFLKLLTVVWGPFAQPLAPILTFGVCFWPVRGYAMTVIQSFGKRGVQFMYGFEDAHGADAGQYAPPRVYNVSEEVSDRIKEYRGIFSDSPSNPRPLFEAAQLFEHHEYFEEAAEAYREIIQLFHRDPAVWAEANFRLAVLHEDSLSNRLGALEILRRIIERAGDTEYGELAAARLHDAASHPDGAPHARPLMADKQALADESEPAQEAGGGSWRT
jgi:hypothetical protein